MLKCTNCLLKRRLVRDLQSFKYIIAVLSALRGEKGKIMTEKEEVKTATELKAAGMSNEEILDVLTEQECQLCYAKFKADNEFSKKQAEKQHKKADEELRAFYAEMQAQKEAEEKKTDCCEKCTTCYWYWQNIDNENECLGANKPCHEYIIFAELQQVTKSSSETSQEHRFDFYNKIYDEAGKYMAEASKTKDKQAFDVFKNERKRAFELMTKSAEETNGK